MNYDITIRKNVKHEPGGVKLLLKKPVGTGAFDPQAIEKQLRGYVIVPNEYWHTLDRTDHIRYIGKDGQFRRGSFIKCIWERDGKKFYQLETTIGGKTGDKGYVCFPVAFEDIRPVYRKIRAYHRPDMERLTHKIDRLEHAIKMMKE